MGPALAKPAGPTYPIELAPGASREGKVCVRLFGVSESEIWVTRVVPNIIQNGERAGGSCAFSSSRERAAAREP